MSRVKREKAELVFKHYIFSFIIVSKMFSKTQILQNHLTILNKSDSF